MNYSKIYYSLIEKRKKYPYEGYTEIHHIIPKSLGGIDDETNLVRLSAREHFICHLLLTKMYEKNTINYYKMIKAFMMMLVCKSGNQQRYITSKKYEKLRIDFSNIQSIQQSGSGNSQYGRPRTEKTKSKIKNTLLKKKENSRKIKEEQKKAKIELKKQNFEKTIETYRVYYDIYSNVGWDEFVRITGYTHSKQNLVGRCAKLLPEFVSQNGRRRGK